MPPKETEGEEKPGEEGEPEEEKEPETENEEADDNESSTKKKEEITEELDAEKLEDETEDQNENKDGITMCFIFSKINFLPAIYGCYIYEFYMESLIFTPVFKISF